jgi:heme-degrading monooxygenase HmoA
MFMRLVQFKIKTDQLSGLRQEYETVVVPALGDIDGCRFAGLIHSARNPDECMSLTLWNTPDHIEAYERSGKYAELLKGLEPYFSDSSKWKIQLSEDSTLEYAPVPEEPVVHANPIGAAMDNNAPGQLPRDTMYLRIVYITIKPGMLDEFRTIYNEEIIPTLRSVQGCRIAYLTESIENREQIYSVTIWDSQADAEKYETSGQFDELTGKIRHTFSELFQWKMELDKQVGGQTATSEDLTIESYAIVTGRNFDLK